MMLERMKVYLSAFIGDLHLPACPEPALWWSRGRGGGECLVGVVDGGAVGGGGGAPEDGGIGIAAASFERR